MGFTLFTNPCWSNKRTLIWEVRNVVLDDFSNSDLQLNKLELLRRHLLHLPALIASFHITAKAGNYRILARSKVRGFIASNYVSEQVESFHE